MSTDTTAEAPSLALQLAPADMVDTTRFDAPRKQQAAVIAASVSVADSNTVATFGAGPQRKLSGFLDQLLTGVRADEIGTAGALVTELATGLKMLDLPGVKREVEGRAGFLARLPVVGRYVSALRRFRAMQKQVVDHMAAIERKAELHLGKLKASNAGLDRLLDSHVPARVPLHLIGNMLFLWIFGVGSGGQAAAPAVLALYLSAGIIGDLLSDFVTGLLDRTCTIWRFGGDHGLAGAYLYLFPYTPIRLLWFMWFFIMPRGGVAECQARWDHFVLRRGWTW